jgi:hypothetical protein
MTTFDVRGLRNARTITVEAGDGVYGVRIEIINDPFNAIVMDDIKQVDMLITGLKKAREALK